MGRRVSKSAPEEVDAYLAAVPEASRAALEQLRKTISSAAPEATEGIGYAIPTFSTTDRWSPSRRRRSTAASTS
jgi:uncharacterized protein YdhG (YjbR/CyaY superfamily)